MRLWLRHALHTAALAFVAWLVVLVLARPWHRRWGSTEEERREALPGDERAANPGRAGDRAITIHAPSAKVWSWLVQMGEDRGGFYSYAALENCFGLSIVNAERIVPEWQQIQAGDFVRATPPDWLRGVFGDRIGWEVDHIVDGRVLALRYWIFEVEALDAETSRLHVRTHAGDVPLPIAPLLLLAFEPAHFVMERAMLVGIKERAERLALRSSSALLPRAALSRSLRWPRHAPASRVPDHWALFQARGDLERAPIMQPPAKMLARMYQEQQHTAARDEPSEEHSSRLGSQ